MKTVRMSLVAAGLVVITALPALAKDLINFEKFTLDNGLRVVVHEDRKAPIVAVSVWYHVGSKNEPRGKTGFAHLFEHLMFKGTENFKGEIFETFRNVGGTNMNGTTWLDRTNYYETVPTPALDVALWYESDRMGHLLGAVTQKWLDDERGVVQNEKRQGEGQPYGTMGSRMSEGLFPESHPYHHSTIGSMADLDGASLEDVKGWFKQYYGAANALVVLSGDIDAAQARPLMEKYFGDIAAGPPLHRMKANIPVRVHNTREEMTDNVSQTVFDRSWIVPGRTTQDKSLLDMVGQILSQGKNSRLYKALVEEGKLVTSVNASVEAHELASVFSISATLRGGVEVSEAEQAVEKILAEFLKKGPTRKEVAKIKSDVEASMITGLESVSRKGNMLAQGALYAGDPAFYAQDIKWTQEATQKDIQKVAQKWLTTGYHQVTVYPFGKHKVTKGLADRSKMPAVKNDLVLDLPDMREAVLSNGMKVVLAQRHNVPMLTMNMVFNNAGSNADQGIKSGTADLTYALMNDGPAGMSASDYTEKVENLHVKISLNAGKHHAAARFRALKKNLRPSLELWAEVLRDPAFRTDDLDRWRVNALQGYARSKNSPRTMAGNAMAAALYPKGHPYATQWNEEELINNLGLGDVKAFHKNLRPDIATLFVVGDTTMAELVVQLEKTFGDWKAPKAAPATVRPIEDVVVPRKPRFILVNRPGPQTTMQAGRLVVATKHVDSRPLDAANSIFGGGLAARIGANLRVDKGWSYGAGSGVRAGLEQRIWRLSTSVQTDKTAQSVVESIKELNLLIGDKPGTQKELDLFIKGRTLSLPGRYERASAVLGTMVNSAAYGRPYDWAEGSKERLEAITLEETNRMARKYFKPENLTWVLVGDLASFEQRLRDLKLGDVEVWDVDGHRIR